MKVLEINLNQIMMLWYDLTEAVRAWKPSSVAEIISAKKSGIVLFSS